MLKIAIENYGISRKKCSSPVDLHVEDLGTSSMPCSNWHMSRKSLLERVERSGISITVSLLLTQTHTLEQIPCFP